MHFGYVTMEYNECWFGNPYNVVIICLTKLNVIGVCVCVCVGSFFKNKRLPRGWQIHGKNLAIQVYCIAQGKCNFKNKKPHQIVELMFNIMH
jgi:hypothetical protein